MLIELPWMKYYNRIVFNEGIFNLMGVISMISDSCRAIADSVKSWWLS